MDGWRADPLTLTIPTHGIDVWRVCLDDVQYVDESLRGLLRPDEVARASRFHFERDRTRFIRGRAALRIVLGRYLRISPADIRFQYKDYGKPAIAFPDACQGLRFNVSHAGGLALIAAGCGTAIGVDIEKVRPHPDLLGIARRFFSARETDAILALSEDQRQEAFFACWTRKEAFLKATGMGLSFPLSKFSVSVDPEGPALLCEFGERGELAGPWSLADVQPGWGFRGALAWAGGARCITQWEFEFAKTTARWFYASQAGKMGSPLAR
jgi:4'-phosphopantetheinyl transferase